MRIEIKLTCMYCGSQLLGEFLVTELLVDPCRKCIDEAEVAGYDEGREDGINAMR
jgi:MoaA/NifB/PqqE/SkfB family radical SAM enzyme